MRAVRAIIAVNQSLELVMIEILLYGWHKNGDYAQRLVGDLSEERMVHMPAGGMNHPAWVLCHLNAYHGVIEALVQRRVFDDPKGHRFGMQSKPVTDASVYPGKGELIESFAAGHGRVVSALQAADPAVLGDAVSLERWRGVMPSVGAALGYLMLVHEATHLGQLSAWRRVQGLPSV